MRAALVQLNTGDIPEDNLPVTLGFLREAAKQGADIILTPEVTNCVSSSRSHQEKVLQHQNSDPTLAALRLEARALGVWVLVGSLALKSEGDDGRFVNRSFLLSPTGEIAAWYDKIHMFDVDISETESYRESSGFKPGDRSVLARTPIGKFGLSICYDVRFPQLYRTLAQAGAEILTVPAAFSPVTGVAHWETLLRARAIETGCFVLAPAQTGTHPSSTGKVRKTYGRSMAISPWGEVLADAGDLPRVIMIDLDLSDVETCRSKLSSLTHDREFKKPS